MGEPAGFNASAMIDGAQVAGSTVIEFVTGSRPWLLEISKRVTAYRAQQYLVHFERVIQAISRDLEGLRARSYFICPVCGITCRSLGRHKRRKH